MELPPSFLKSLPIPDSERNDFIAALHTPAPVSFRINEAKAKIATQADPIPWVSNGYYLEKRPRFTSDPAFHAGAYYPQEASSMFLSHILKVLNLNRAPLKALDLCAAPGGKSTILRTDLHPDSYLVANEVIKSRVPLLEENLIKWGKTGFSVTSADPFDFSALPDFFDLMVVDAPCSGEGLFRKLENAIEQWSPKAVEMCASRQKRILKDVWPSLRPGGYLIYSTCTYNRKENEENLNWLNSKCGAESFPIDLQGMDCIQEIEYQGMYGYRFMPHRTKGEGFFVAVVRKPEGRIKKQKIGSGLFQNITIPGWNTRDNSSIIINKNQACFAIGAGHFKSIHSVLHAFNQSTPGIPIGKLYGQKFKADHGLSQMVNTFYFAELVELDLEDAILYLERNDVSKPKLKPGHYITGFDGFKLGFAKAQQKRLVSQYPLNWRIRQGRPEKYIKLVSSLS